MFVENCPDYVEDLKETYRKAGKSTSLGLVLSPEKGQTFGPLAALFSNDALFVNLR
jgi:hypothetical protein